MHLPRDVVGVPAPPTSAEWQPVPWSNKSNRESVVYVGTDVPVTEVRFLLVNMPKCRLADPVRDVGSTWLGRERLQDDGWDVSLDGRSDDTEADVGRTGGYAVTHVGRLRRRDGGPFRQAEALDALRLLALVCTLSAARWVAAVLPVGVDPDGLERWAVWGTPRVDAWQTQLTFTDPLVHDHLPDLFRACSARWHGGERSRWTLRRAVQYFVGANEARPREWSVVAAVSAC